MCSIFKNDLGYQEDISCLDLIYCAFYLNTHFWVFWQYIKASNFAAIKQLKLKAI